MGEPIKHPQREPSPLATYYLTGDLRKAVNNSGAGLLRVYADDIRRDEIWKNLRRFGP